MKTNEAPEKLYFGTQGDKGLLDIYSEKESDDDIEYTRTDVFIKNTCEWIKSMWSETDDRFKEDYTGMLIDIFKNYIKGK